MPSHSLPLPCRDTPPSQDKDALPGKKKPARAKEGNALCPIRLVFTYIIRALIDSYIICIFISHQGVTLSFALNRFLSLYLNISQFCYKVHLTSTYYAEMTIVLSLHIVLNLNLTTKFM